MKLLSIIFFISAVISVILSVLAFLGKIPGKGKDTGIVFAIASGVFGICELTCIWNSPKGLILIVCSVLLIDLIFTVARNEEDSKVEK